MDYIRQENTENTLFLKKCIKDAREAVIAYVMHTTRYQLRYISDRVEQQLTLFLAYSSSKQLKILFEKQPTPARKFSASFSGYNNEYLHFQLAKTLDEFLFSIHLILSDLFKKYYVADKSITHLEEASKILEKCSSQYIGNFIRNLYPSGTILYHMFGNLHMKDELQKALRIGTDLRNRFEKDWKPRGEDDKINNHISSKSELKKLQETWHNEKWVFNEVFGKRFNFTDFKSLENAFRLGKVNEKKYLVWKEKSDKRHSAEIQLIEAVDKFVKEIGFARNISYINTEIKSMNLTIVCPPVNFQDRFDLLEIEQSWEYFEIFENGKNLLRYVEYGIIRTNEILISLISNYDQTNSSYLKSEINYFLAFLSKFETKNLHFIDRRKIATIFENYSLISKFISHYEKLSIQDRTIKLKFLKETDTVNIQQIYEAHSTFEFGIYESNESGIEIIQLNKPKISEKLQIRLRICISSDYIRLAITDINYLKIFKETLTDKEKLLKSKLIDKKNYISFRETIISKEFENIVKHSKEISSKTFVECYEKYLICLIEVGKEFHPANMKLLKLDTIIPELISLFVKSENWHKVLYWAEWYFNLPSNFRYSLSQKNEQYLRKQMERSKKAMDKS